MLMDLSNSKVLFTHKEISDRIHKLATTIVHDYKQSDKLVVICVLRGAVFFLTKLLSDFPSDMDNVSLEFIRTSSYGDDETESSGSIKILADIQEDIANKDVLIVEDIIDTGITLYTLKDILLKRNPKSLKICCMLNKQARRVRDIEADYIGFEVPNVFIYGMGLDPNRHLQDIYCIGDTVTKEENLARLDRYSKFESDWDGYGAKPNSMKVIETVKAILNEIHIQPLIFPIGSGDIQLEWEDHGIYMELDVFKDTNLNSFEVFETDGMSCRYIQFSSIDQLNEELKVIFPNGTTSFYAS